MKISLAHLTAIDLSPDQLIYNASKIGYDAVGLRLKRVTDNTPAYPLKKGSLELKKTLNAIKDTNIIINDIEFFKIDPNFKIDNIISYLEIGELLGAKQIITAPYDNNTSRLKENLGILSEYTSKHNIETLIEFFPWTPVNSYSSAKNLINGTQAKILLDTLHFNRSCSFSSEIAHSDPIGLVHLSDAKVKSHYSEDELFHTAREDRLIPGQGEINLMEILMKVNINTNIGIEIPCAPSGKLNNSQLISWVNKCFSSAKKLIDKRVSYE